MDPLCCVGETYQNVGGDKNEEWFGGYYLLSDPAEDLVRVPGKNKIKMGGLVRGFRSGIVSCSYNLVCTVKKEVCGEGWC